MKMAQSKLAKPPCGPGQKGAGIRKLWSNESMILAVKNVEDGLEAARQYNVPVETLRRRVTGAVSTDCRPGPPTVLTSEEETRLAQFLIEMSDMGFGLTREDVMRTAFSIVSQAGRVHPFQNGTAGRSWFDALNDATQT